MAKRSKKKPAIRTNLASPGTEASGDFFPKTTFGKFFAAAWLPLALALITFLVYWPSLKSEFVSDARLEINEGFVTSLSNLPSVLSAHVLGMNLMLSDRPGEILYLMLNSALWGKEPFGYHLSSNLLHAANVALLFVLLRRLTSVEATDLARRHPLKIQLAAVAATLIFALHPIATESVSEVSFSSNLLVTFFTLLALLAATAFRPDHPKTALIAGTAGVLCAFAAILTKESGLTLVGLLLVYWFLFRRREAKGPWLLFLGSAAALTAAVLLAILHFAVSRQLKLDYLGGSFAHVFLIQPQLWVFMMGQLLWPFHLSADYVLEDMSLPSTSFSFAILIVVVALQAWLAWKSRLGALGVATYWGGLATVSNFVPLYCILADRFYYLPLVGVAMQLTALLLMAARSRQGYALAILVCLVPLPLLGYLSLARQAVFANEFSLYEATLKLSPHSSLMHNSLALALFQKGDVDSALAQYQQTLEIDPKNSCANVSIGMIDLQRGQPDAAVAQFQKALAINSQDSDAHCSLGMALCQMGQLEEGINELHQALAIDPTDATAYNNLGLALLQQGQFDPAITQFQKALNFAPGSTQARYNLGNAFARQEKWDQAVQQFQKILQDDPSNFEALTNLGVALMHQGRLDEAIARYHEALKIHPDSADLHDDLGVALIQKNEVNDAISEFAEAVRLQPDFTVAQANLAKAKAQQSAAQK